MHHAQRGYETCPPCVHKARLGEWPAKKCEWQQRNADGSKEMQMAAKKCEWQQRNVIDGDTGCGGASDQTIATATGMGNEQERMTYKAMGFELPNNMIPHDCLYDII